MVPVAIVMCVSHMIQERHLSCMVKRVMGEVKPLSPCLVTIRALKNLE